MSRRDYGRRGGSGWPLILFVAAAAAFVAFGGLRLVSDLVDRACEGHMEICDVVWNQGVKP